MDDELERAVTQSGFKGALVNGHTNGEYLDERKFWGVWEHAEQLGVPIYLHPADIELMITNSTIGSISNCV